MHIYVSGGNKIKQFDITCPNCGGYLNAEIGKLTYICGYCRQKISISELNCDSDLLQISEKENFSSIFDKNLLKLQETSEIYKKIDVAFLINNWNAVKCCCDELIRRNPINHHAYMFNLLADYKVLSKEDLKKAEAPLEENENFKKLMYIADEDLRLELEEYNKCALNNYEASEKIKRYSNAITRYIYAETENDCINAANIFKELDDYEDSAIRYLKCIKKANAIALKNRIKQMIKILLIAIAVITAFLWSLDKKL